MPSLIWSARALSDLERINTLLAQENPALAREMVAEVRNRANLLNDFPAAGRPVPDLSSRYRELILRRGKGALILRYSLEEGRPVILRVHHSLEDGF